MKLKIDSNEVKQILEMHSKLRKKVVIEQEEKVVTNQDEIDKKFLNDCEIEGCLSNGEIRFIKGTTKPVYQATTLNSKEVVLFYPDKTYKFPKTGETGKWKCTKVEQKKAQEDALRAEEGKKPKPLNSNQLKVLELIKTFRWVTAPEPTDVEIDNGA
jgi:hypothetical protein